MQVNHKAEKIKQKAEKANKNKDYKKARKIKNTKPANVNSLSVSMVSMF